MNILISINSLDLKKTLILICKQIRQFFSANLIRKINQKKSPADLDKFPIDSIAAIHSIVKAASYSIGETLH